MGYPIEGMNPNLELFQKVVSKISFSNFPIPISVRMRGDCIRITISTPDREIVPEGLPSRPRMILLESVHEVPAWFKGPQDLDIICKWILDHVMELLRHEIYEQFLLDGIRVFDPHKVDMHAVPKGIPEQLLADLFPLAPSKHP